MINPELWMVGIPPVSWGLFALGGTQISPTIKGMKWIRRFILPIVLGVCVWLGLGNGWLNIVRACAVAGLGIGFLSMGYGNGKTWLYRFMVGCLYGCISLPLGISWWNLACPIVFITFFVLSNVPVVAKIFTWKICEGMFGLSIGVSIAYLLMGNGIVW